MKSKIFKLIIIGFMVVGLSVNFVYSNEKGISLKTLKELKKCVNLNNPEFKMRLNAISNNNPSLLIKDTEVIKSFNDFHFSNKIKTKGITNQMGTGRCWLFAGYNVLRYFVIKKLELNKFELSQNYGMFFDKLEKANLFLEGIIDTAKMPLLSREVGHWLKNPIPDGGQWNMVVDLVDKYGVVPKEVMPETYNSSHSSSMNRVLSNLLKKDAITLRNLVNKGVKRDKIEKEKVKMLKDVYRLLVYFLGIPPEEFYYRYETKDKKISDLKKYTPKSFYKEFIGLNLKDYIMVYNTPHREYWKTYAIEHDKNMADKSDMVFVNLPINELKNLAKNSIINGEPVWFGCDVGKEFDGKKGFLLPRIHDYKSLYKVDFSMTKKQRILYYQSIPTHAMVLTAVDIQNNKPTKWLVENSWGTKSGRNGYLVMKDEWFEPYVFEVVINKKYISKKVLKLLKQKPILLPPWDPMFNMNCSN